MAPPASDQLQPPARAGLTRETRAARRGRMRGSGLASFRLLGGHRAVNPTNPYPFSKQCGLPLPSGCTAFSSLALCLVHGGQRLQDLPSGHPGLEWLPGGHVPLVATRLLVPLLDCSLDDRQRVAACRANPSSHKAAQATESAHGGFFQSPKRDCGTWNQSARYSRASGCAQAVVASVFFLCLEPRGQGDFPHPPTRR